MSLYQNMISNVCQALIDNKLEYADTIIVGDNSSGKSEVLKQLVRMGNAGDYYYIDAVNRYFNIQQVTDRWIYADIHYSPGIVDQRMDDETFNHIDTFYYDKIPMSIETLYSVYSERIQSLMKDFLDVEFDIRLGQTGREAYVDDKNVDLSSGYQAILRLFIEILYVSATNGSGTIIIDEADEFLSAKNSGRIFDFLRKRFAKFNFIITTHSADLIANAEQCNLVLLEGDGFEVLDAGDFASVSQVYNIFNSLFDVSEKDTKTKIDDALRRFLNNKMSGIWTDEDDVQLKALKEKTLTKAQRLVVRQIEEWEA